VDEDEFIVIAGLRMPARMTRVSCECDAAFKYVEIVYSQVCVSWVLVDIFPKILEI